MQYRAYEGHTLLWRGRLFQQYIIDCYTCIEENHFCWVRKNQPQLRLKLYYGLKDAILRGDTNASSVGKCIVLSFSFTDGPKFLYRIIKML